MGVRLSCCEIFCKYLWGISEPDSIASDPNAPDPIAAGTLWDRFPLINCLTFISFTNNKRKRSDPKPAANNQNTKHGITNYKYPWR